MPAVFGRPGFEVVYTLIDAHELDGNELLESSEIGDNLIAALARLRDHRDAIHRMVAKVAGLPHGAREEAMVVLYRLAGLRRLVPFVKQEIETMPLDIDLREKEVLGPPYIRGLEEGEAKGRKEGELSVLRRLIEKRFGAVPPSADAILVAKSLGELEELSVLVLDAASIDELLK
jgi:Domain of unknown function (DUF4351)